MLTAKEQSLNMELDQLRDPQRLARRGEEARAWSPRRSPPSSGSRRRGARQPRPRPPRPTPCASTRCPTPKPGSLKRKTVIIKVRAEHHRRPRPQGRASTSAGRHPRHLHHCASRKAVGRRPAPRPTPEQRIDTSPSAGASDGSLRGSTHVRLRVGLLVIAMLLSLFGARLFQLQGVDSRPTPRGRGLRAWCTIDLPAKRGQILDRNGVPLAESIAGHDGRGRPDPDHPQRRGDRQDPRRPAAPRLLRPAGQADQEERHRASSTSRDGSPRRWPRA